jgi:hypothetical protein
MGEIAGGIGLIWAGINTGNPYAVAFGGQFAALGLGTYVAGLAYGPDWKPTIKWPEMESEALRGFVEAQRRQQQKENECPPKH